MRREKQRVLTAATLVVLSSVAVAAYINSVRAQENVAATAPFGDSGTYTYDGVELAFAASESTEETTLLKSLLGVQIWKLAVRTSKPSVKVLYKFEIREPGKPVKPLFDGVARFSSSDGKSGISSLQLAMMPVQGGLRDAQRIKLLIKGTGIAQKTVDMDNPFRGALSWGEPGSTKEKDIPLISGRIPLRDPSGSTGPSAERTLFLKLETEKDKK